MTRLEYNRKVQELQGVFSDTRVRPIYSQKDELVRSVFEVFWDGKWCAVGIERFPMSEKTEWHWDEDLGNQLLYKAADSLSRS